jgi:hypothetical protein
VIVAAEPAMTSALDIVSVRAIAIWERMPRSTPRAGKPWATWAGSTQMGTCSSRTAKST